MKDLILSLRPGQWIKNLFVFAAPVFGRVIMEPRPVLRTAAVFGIFCLLAGALYLANDVLDAEADRLHPRKCRRPIAAGRLRPGRAWVWAAILGAAGLAAAAVLDRRVLLTVAAYVFLQTAYSLALKRVVILDVFIVASGFVLRVAAGGFAADVVPSSWLLICTSLLALLLAVGKRRNELLLLEDRGGEHRAVLREYTPVLLDQMIAVVTAATVVSYALYAMDTATVQRFGSGRLLWSAPFVLYGIFRYLYLVYRRGEGGTPEEMIVKDPPFLAAIVLWIAVTAAIIYL
ncbi:MAG: decaprenyl-phosphate phosphoribosyltransferase [Acidobacteriota bacterium]|nr:decaprenyl-phosphate phosphoribosyltransferase [Acidobacteriota bacterium]